jgi:biotin transporter BioY
MAFHINPFDGIFIGDFFGFLISLPIGLFLAFWFSAIKRRSMAVLGAFLGALIGFIVIYAWIGTLLFDPPVLASNPGAAFFASALFCSILALAFAILIDVLVASKSTRDYRRAAH